MKYPLILPELKEILSEEELQFLYRIIFESETQTQTHPQLKKHEEIRRVNTRGLVRSKEILCSKRLGRRPPQIRCHSLMGTCQESTVAEATFSLTLYAELCGRIQHQHQQNQMTEKKSTRPQYPLDDLATLGVVTKNPLYKAFNPQGKAKGLEDISREVIGDLVREFNDWITALT